MTGKSDDPITVYHNSTQDGANERLEQRITRRGTHFEMIQTVKYGIACYMDGVLQSTEADEKVYHEGLVGMALLSLPPSTAKKNVLILGGGEGATAREVLKSSAVGHVDMVDWDEEVVQRFREAYPQWARGAWDDPRLHLHYEDAFHYHSTMQYDLVIIDLFDPEGKEDVPRFHELLCRLQTMMVPHGTLVMYTGVYQPCTVDFVYELLTGMAATATSTMQPFPLHSRIPYRVVVPSFEGESTFLLFRVCD